MHELIDGGLVVGGGLAGLALSAALIRGGFPVEILRPRDSSDGENQPEGGLWLWGGALAALERADLLESVRARGAPLERFRLWSGRGILLCELGADEVSPDFGAVAISTRALLTLLREACASVETHGGGRLLGYSEDGRGVVVQLAGGGIIRTPIAVGADGPFSRVRVQCLDDGPPIYSGDTVWQGMAPRTIQPPGILHHFWGHDGLRGGAMVVDRAGNTAWWLDRAIGTPGVERPSKVELRGICEHLRGPLSELIEATPEDRIQRREIFARRGVRLPGAGRVTLVGDAAHPFPATLRMGANAAIEDAVVLAEALVADANPVRAFRGFEARRSPRLTWQSGMLWRLRAIEARQTPLGARARDLAVKNLPGGVLGRLLNRLFGTSRKEDLDHDAAHLAEL